MKYLVLILSLFALSCSPSKDDSRVANKGGTGNGGDNGKNEKPGTQLKNTTDYSLCGAGPSTLTTPEGRWEMFESSEKFYFKIALEFNTGTLTLRRDCYSKTRRLTAQVTVPASYDQGIIKVLADATDLKKTPDKDGVDCKVDLTQGVANYGFAGHCLELRAFQGREFLKFAPQ